MSIALSASLRAKQGHMQTSGRVLVNQDSLTHFAYLIKWRETLQLSWHRSSMLWAEAASQFSLKTNVKWVERNQKEYMIRAAKQN